MKDIVPHTTANRMNPPGSRLQKLREMKREKLLKKQLRREGRKG
jgi:hypothetical protein